MQSSAPRSGFLATRSDMPLDDAGLFGAQLTEHSPVSLSAWGCARIEDAGSRTTLVLSRFARRTDGRVPDGEIIDAMVSDPGRLRDLLPPFGAVQADTAEVRFTADAMGFEHLFHFDDPARAMVSTSALLVGALSGAALDPVAVAVQSRLGWQLGELSLFEGVRKLRPGASGTLHGGGVTLKDADEVREEIEPEQAVAETTDVLRRSLRALLDEHPDAVLQLTGGMDSRLLLSAIPPARRRGLHVMTLDVPGAHDVQVARTLAERFGMLHHVHGLADVAGLTPAQAWEACRAEATRLDAMSDPLALAAQRIAERAFPQGVRISGLGGEVARGFYYTGRVRDRTFDRTDAARLANWRMFVNEAVEPGLLTDEFTGWAHERAVDEVHAALRAGGSEWFRATDELYLRHRMQRWAGATDVAVSDQRVVINPMLDPRFLDAVVRLRPQNKANARFLGALQVALDPELARIPLEGRGAPISYAEPSARDAVLNAYRTGRRLTSKISQRVRRGNRPPAGGDVLAAKVVEHWRERPQIIAGLSGLPFLSQDWLEAVLVGARQPRPSSVALLTNLIVATAHPVR